MFFYENDPPSLEDALTDEIVAMENKDGLKRLYALIWKIGIRLAGLDSEKKGFITDGNIIKELSEKNSCHYYARASLDAGMIDGKLDDDFSYMFLIPEPDNGFKSCFDNTEDLKKVFSVLAEDDALNVLFSCIQELMSLLHY